MSNTNNLAFNDHISTPALMSTGDHDGKAALTSLASWVFNVAHPDRYVARYRWMYVPARP